MAKKYQCLEYAVERFLEDNDKNPATERSDYAYQYWGNVPEKNRHMHIKEHSIAIWKTKNATDGLPGHAGYIEEIKPDGTICFAHANVNGDESVHFETYSDAYYMARGMGKGLTFVGYVK